MTYERSVELHAGGEEVDTVLRQPDLTLLRYVGREPAAAGDAAAANIILGMTGRQIKDLRGRLVAESLRMLELEAKIKAAHRAITHTLRAVTEPHDEGEHR